MKVIVPNFRWHLLSISLKRAANFVVAQTFPFSCFFPLIIMGSILYCVLDLIKVSVIETHLFVKYGILTANVKET